MSSTGAFGDRAGGKSGYVLTTGAIAGGIAITSAAIAVALAGAGIALYIIQNNMQNYWSNTGFSYLHIDLVNDYYYHTSLALTLASSVGEIGVYNNGNSCTIIPNIPLSGVAIGSELAHAADILSA